jgi:hypothetical protein
MRQTPQGAAFATGSATNPIAISDSPAPQQGSALNPSSNPYRSILQANAGNPKSLPKPKGEGKKKGPKPQPWRSHENGAYKQGTGELYRGVLFVFLGDYLGIFHPAEQLPKPFKYPEQLARWNLFSQIEKAHFHAFAKNLVDAELLADRQQEARKRQKEARRQQEEERRRHGAAIASDTGTGGLGQVIPGNAAVSRMNIGGDMLSQPVFCPKPRRPPPQWTVDMLEDEASTNAQLLSPNRNSQDELEFGFSIQPQMAWANGPTTGVDYMGIQQPHYQNPFSQGMQYSNATQGLRDHEPGNFEGAYGSYSEDQPRYAPNQPMADHLPANPATQGRKRNAFDDDFGAGEEMDDSPRATKRTRRV